MIVWPISIGVQTQVLNRCMLLQLKVVVVSDAVKRFRQKRDQVSVRKLNFTEPLMKCRNGYSSAKA